LAGVEFKRLEDLENYLEPFRKKGIQEIQEKSQKEIKSVKNKKEL